MSNITTRTARAPPPKPFHDVDCGGSKEDLGHWRPGNGPLAQGVRGGTELGRTTGGHKARRQTTSKEDRREARKAGRKVTIGGRGQVYPHGAGPEKGTRPQREHSMSHLRDTRGVWGPQHAAPPSTEACRDTALVGLRGPACQGISGHHTPRGRGGQSQHGHPSASRGPLLPTGPEP